MSKINLEWDRFLKMFECKLYIWGILCDDKSWKSNWWKIRYKMLKGRKI